MAAETIDLLVVNHNTKDLLKRLLDYLKSDDDGVSWNLYLADNGSADGSRHWIVNNASQYRLEQVYFNPNIGYANAVNIMAFESHSPYLAALNADVWMTTEDVVAIIDRFKTDAKIAVVGPKQRDENYRIRHGGIVGSNIHPRHRGWQALDTYDNAFRDVDDVITVAGSAYFMRRDTWNEMTRCEQYQRAIKQLIDKTVEGAFLPTPHYFEETWYSYHVRYHGYRVVYDGAVSIGHTWRASTGASSRLREYFIESKKMFVTACEIHGIEHD